MLKHLSGTGLLSVPEMQPQITSRHRRASRSSHRSHLLCSSSSAIRRRLPGSQRQPAATAAAAARSDDAPAVHDKEQQEPLEALIADVLNSNKAQLQRPSDLLSLIDASGHGISTLVRRSWDTTSVRLALEGSWSSCSEARKMAMLAVYQERLVTRAAGLLRTLHWVVAEQPELLDAAVVQQVEALAAADDINPAVQVLMVPQLTLLAAGLYPWPVLATLVETAVAAAQQTLLSKPPYSYSQSKRKAAVQQLQWVEASLCRGAALARLRALLIQRGRLQHWQQQADTAAAAAGAALQGLTAEQAYHEWWKQQPPQLQEQQAFLGSAAAGRPLLASFHSRNSSKQWQYQQASGLAATAAASAAAGGAWDVAAAAREQQQLCCSISQLTERVRRLKQELGATEAALGVLPEVQTAHRSALLDLLVTWADASPAAQGSPEAPVVQARVAISSIEHDRLLRRIALEATGAETRVLRQLARSKGREFLAHFSPTVGNPFGSTPEWDYFRDCPGVFARFVVDPPTDTATLTFKQQAAAAAVAQQPAAAEGDTEVVLSGPELQQLQQQLLLVLAGSNAAAAGSNAAAAGSSSSNDSRVVQLRPISGRSLAPVSSRARGGAAAGGLELLLGGSVAAVLQPVHVVSLVTVFDDLGGQLPQQYSTSRQMQAVQVTPAPGWGAALQAATSAINSAARAAAGAALLALPLIAMARPFRAQQQQQLPPAATAATVAASATAVGSTSPAAAAAAAPAGVLLNDSLSERELLQICAALQQRLEGRVWLSSKEARVDEATAASILAGSGSSSSSSGDRRHSSSSSSSSDKLMYQVVLDAAGRVLGVSPCTPEAAAAVWELPLAVELRESKLAKVQERRAKAVAEAIQGKPSKNPPPSSGSQISYSRAQQQPLPADGAVAVLKLLLTPAALRDTPAAAAAAAVTAAAAAAEPGSNSGAQQQQQQRPPGVVVIGSGKAATAMWLMQAQVTPWNDDDSLQVWASKGAVLQQVADPQQAKAISGGTDTAAAAAAAAGVGGAGSGMALTVDGQEVQSMEAFVQQLIALSQQAQQAQQQQ